MTSPHSIFWFRNDLRLDDNPGLFEACKAGEVLAIYIHDDQSPADWSMGGASRVWLHHSLSDLQQRLDGKLHVYSGSPIEVLSRLIDSYQIDNLYWNRCYEPWCITRDTAIKSMLTQRQVTVTSYNAALLWEPWTVVKSDGTPYKVFTPYYRRGCLSRPSPREPLPAPDLNKIVLLANEPTAIDTLGLLSGRPWESEIISQWNIGELAAKQRLGIFINHRIHQYKEQRNYPAEAGVSNLSPHLHFGEISPHTIWHFTAQSLMQSQSEEDVDCFLSEIAWREFSYYLLYHFPELPAQNLQPRFDRFPWSDTPDDTLLLWKLGKTGFPIVDAGMRELWQTGYMHNRVRMIVGSFLVKNLLIDWRLGQAWFWDCLFDADLASNSAGWQWIAGCGADAAPYFRIFNPVTQGEKFDAHGSYVRQYVPELAALPDKYIHAPWTMPDTLAQELNFKKGTDYPDPIVDLKDSRARALEAFSTLKTAPSAEDIKTAS